MGIDYDSWLEKPYQDELVNERFYIQAEEEYPLSDEYKAALADWLADNPGETEDSYCSSSEFDYKIEQYAERLMEDEATSIAEARLDSRDYDSRY